MKRRYDTNWWWQIGVERGQRWRGMLLHRRGGCSCVVIIVSGSILHNVASSVGKCHCCDWYVVPLLLPVKSVGTKCLFFFLTDFFFLCFVRKKINHRAKKFAGKVSSGKVSYCYLTSNVNFIVVVDFWLPTTDSVAILPAWSIPLVCSSLWWFVRDQVVN